jgi:hypothetical protein
LTRDIILQLELYITAQPKEKHQKQAFDIPYFSHFWDFHEIKYCWICGIIETPAGGECKFCKSKFPIKKS